MTAPSKFNRNTNLNRIDEIRSNIAVEVGNLLIIERTFTGKHTLITKILPAASFQNCSVSQIQVTAQMNWAEFLRFDYKTLQTDERKTNKRMQIRSVEQSTNSAV